MQLTMHRFAPEGPRRGTALLLHAMLADARYQFRFAAWLARSGIETFALDFRGHGGSRPPTIEQGWRFTDHVAFDLPAALAAARRSADGPVTVVGHSLGGLAIVAQGPRRADGIVGKVVLVAATVWRRAEVAGLRLAYEAAGMTVLRLLGALGRPMRARRLRLGTADEPSAWAADLSRWWRTSEWDHDARAARMDVPVLAFAGERDSYCPPAHAARFLARAGTGPKRLVAIGGMDHFGFYREDVGQPAWGGVVENGA